MAHKTDLYSLLQSYANKSRSPYIEMKSFLTVLEQNAKRFAKTNPEWTEWTTETGRKVWERLNVLVSENRCHILKDDNDTRIFIPELFIDLIRNEYMSPDNSAGLPFPGESSFGFIIPTEQLRVINVENDLPKYIHDPQTTLLPVLKLIFPASLGGTLILSDMIPDTILDMAILKIRNYLRSRNNKDYINHKLLPAFQTKDSHLRDIINQIILKPFESMRTLREGGDFSYLFWSHFCIFLKKDLYNKKDKLAEEIAALEAVFIIEVFNNHFKSIAAKAREAEAAFCRLESIMKKPPYLYTLDDIIKFTDANKIPLLGQYSDEALDQYLKTKTTVAAKNELPELLIINDPDKVHWYIRKENMLPLCAKLLVDARVVIRKAIAKRWQKLIKDYGSEPAMETDAEFEKLLNKHLCQQAPSLAALLDDEKLFLLYVEMEEKKGEIPESSRIFRGGDLIPYSELLLIRRKDLISDAKMLLPFWYSIPILVAILSLIRNFKNKKKKDEQPSSGGKELQENKIIANAKILQNKLIPQGETMDSCLKSLMNRWNYLLVNQAKEDLTHDVNALIRDRLKLYFRVQHRSALNEDSIYQLANDIIMQTPSLQRIVEKDALVQYIQLYIVKDILNKKI